MAKQSFSRAGISAAPGERAARVLALELNGIATSVPVFVINGAHPGKTIAITAAIHGGEYVGSAAAVDLARSIDPAALHGQLVIVPVCSMIAFQRRAIYLCAPDDKNLNRRFPGDAAGSFTDQLADWIFKNIIMGADAYMDLHGGDLNEALVPFSIIRTGKHPALDAESMALAQAFGLKYIVTGEVKGATVGAASDAGIPAVLTEVGGQGSWTPAEVAQMAHGLRNSLMHLGALEGAVASAPTTVLETFDWVRSAHDGLWRMNCAVGDTVKKDQILGVVTDYLGETLQSAVAPSDGVVLFLVGTLATNAGEPLFAIGA